MKLLFFGISSTLLLGTCYPKENVKYVVEDGPYGGNGGGLIHTYLPTVAEKVVNTPST